MALSGIDISTYQGNINWTKVKTSGKVQFVIIRAGYGVKQDDRFNQNYQGCKSNGIPCGIYWFCKAVNTAEAVQEANACLKAIAGKSFEYPIFYDIEDVNASDKKHTIASLGITKVSAIAVAFLETLRKSGISNLGVYSFKSALDTLFQPDVLQSYKVWVAQLGTNTYTKSAYTMWQYSWKGIIPGIVGKVDLDYDYGTLSSVSTGYPTAQSIPTQISKVEFAVQWAIMIANDDSHGYDQGNRWGPDYDCSSLVITAYETAGVPVKTNKASNTRDMQAVFLKTGFELVPGFSDSNYSMLKRGDVLLSHGHTEMYIGDGQLVGASINESGGTHGGKTGDQKGNEIRVRDYYRNGWYCAMRYTVGDYTTNTLGFNGLLSYGAGNPVYIDWTQLTPYIATIDRDCKEIDYDKLKDMKVVALMIEGGYLYDKSHMVVSRYRNTQIDDQVKNAKEHELPYALYADVRARNVDEAKAELHELQFLIQKYTPPLGCWLTFSFKEDEKEKNDSIIKVYKEKLHKLGLVGKIGFYVNRDQLNTISWDEWQEEFYWWMVEDVSDIAEVEQLLYPEFFMLDPSNIEAHQIIGTYGSSEGVVYNTDVPSYGDTVVIPATVNQSGIIANYTNYTYWFSHWSRSSVQHQIAMLWDQQGRPNSRGIATVSGHYLLAMAPKFGTTGDLLTITLEDNTKFTAIMADSKGSDAPTSWGHVLNGKIDIIEWEKIGPSNTKVSNVTMDLTGWKGKKVYSVKNHGKFSGLK